MSDAHDNTAAGGSYTVMARRFRPQTFEDVVGQEHVGQALRNAIASGRVAHAYLFTGARGVGKTSTARIFAKALNCPNTVDGVPCNECELCRSISTGSDVDVLEIDGASNRGIDDIRQLRANVNVRSMRTRYKVYIIDEVHMLTKEAFNALLKTLEEPPPGVKFVFCTTEPNKVPDTILSRCQRFDFGMIARDGIATRLEQIATAEGVDVAPEAIELVARRGGGSMRDAQSLFDQLLSFGSAQISTDDVHRLLGTAPDERLVSLADAIIQTDRAQVLELLDDAVEAGVQLGSLSDQLLEYLRDMLIAAVGAEQVSLLSVGEGMRGRLREQSERWGLETVSAAMQVLAETKFRMQRSNSPRALLELALIRLSLLERLEGLAVLASQLQSGQGLASGTSTVRPASRSAGATGPTAAGTLKKKVADSASDAGEEHSQVAVSADGPEPLEFVPENSDAFFSQLVLNSKDATANQLKRASKAAIFGPNTLDLTFPKSYVFSKNYCERAETINTLRALASKLAGRSIDITIRLDESSEPRPAVRSVKEPQSTRRSPTAATDDALVNAALSTFGGSVIEVRSLPPAGESEG
jgi:DNA polymerase III subunit gamma/tau